MEIDENSTTLNEAVSGTISEDELEREIDVYLSPELSYQMYLLQYPLQHEAVATPVSARIKPRHGMLQEDHQVPLQYIEQEGMYFMDQRTYDSHTIPVSTHLCIGKLERPNNSDENNHVTTDSLHLVPLTHISQMRPSFRHVDEEEEHNNAVDSVDGDPNNNKKKNEADEDSPEKKPVIFQRKESERAAMARKSSYAFKRTSENTEEWLQLSVHGNEDEEEDDDDDDGDDIDDSIMTGGARRNLLQKLKCPSAARNVSVVSDDAAEKDYVQSLNYLSVVVAQNNEEEQGVPAPHGSVDVKTIAGRMTILLQSGSPIPFSILRSQFHATIPDDVLFQALNTCAVLCRGNWCLHSKFLASLSEPLKRLRTFLLLLLQDKGVVDRSRLSRVYGGESSNNSSIMTPNTMLASLKLVGKRKIVGGRNSNGGENNSGWVLKVGDDTAFLEKHRDLQQLHDAYWTRQRQRFGNELRVYDQ